jgi:DNA-binding CsgD family transcriptional regulator
MDKPNSRDVSGASEQPSAQVSLRLVVASSEKTEPGGDDSAYHSPIEKLLQGVAIREVGAIANPNVTAEVLEFVLNTHSTPALVVDRNLRIMFSNTAAETALTQGGCLKRHGRDLVVQSEKARKFADFVDAAGRGCPVKRSLILEGGPGRPAMAVWFRPIDPALQTSSPLWSRGLISISLRLLSRPPVLTSALLRMHYGLTSRQSEVVSRLALGASLVEIGVAMGVEITTLRSHLSKAFQKTSTRGQSELIALVLSLASPVQE